MFHPAYYSYNTDITEVMEGGEVRAGGGWPPVCSLVVSRTLPDLATVGVRSRWSRSGARSTLPDNTTVRTVGRCSPDLPPALPNLADTWRPVFEPYLTSHHWWPYSIVWSVLYQILFDQISVQHCGPALSLAHTWLGQHLCLFCVARSVPSTTCLGQHCCLSCVVP